MASFKESRLLLCAAVLLALSVNSAAVDDEGLARIVHHIVRRQASSHGQGPSSHSFSSGSSGHSGVAGSVSGSQTYSYPYGQAHVQHVNPSSNQHSTYTYSSGGSSSGSSSISGSSGISGISGSSAVSGGNGGGSGGNTGSSTTYYYRRSSSNNGRSSGQQQPSSSSGGGRYVSGQTTYRTNRRTAYTGSRTQNSQCPDTGIEMRIGGMSCTQAISYHGSALCYAHERSSRQCCQTCLARKRTDAPGCEYGDRSHQCRNIRARACYNHQNRNLCCETCPLLRRTVSVANCEYGDRSDQCAVVRSNPGLCYNADNRRMCCETCAHLKNSLRPQCPWGDRDSQMCRPFVSNSTDVRINCYQPRIRNLCCNSCRRIREWVPSNLPANCQYGDHPVTFIVQGMGNLRCSNYFNHFPVSHCNDPSRDVTRYCCYTCHRMLNRG